MINSFVSVIAGEASHILLEVVGINLEWKEEHAYLYVPLCYSGVCYKHKLK